MATLAVRNRRVVIGLSLLLAAVVALVAVSVPLYRMICRVTGLGGTTQVATEAAAEAAEREAAGLPTITVRFNADVNEGLPWSFYPLQREVTAQLGVPQTIYYRAVNRSNQRLTGTATFNVTPDEAGLYFDKIQCFCFDRQTLEPGQSEDMAVRFFVDPALLQDPDGKSLKTITLSYTFFRAKDEAGSQPQASRTDGASPTSIN
jgi:cytochrome c oxidase assembly protein subunit 11